MQSLTGNGIFGTKTLTETSIATPTEQATDSFGTHMLALEARNLTELLGQYEENATVTWTGNTPGSAGNYYGEAQLQRLFENSFIVRATTVNVGNLTWSVVATRSGFASVNSTVGFAGFSPVCGPFSIKVSAQDSFAYSAMKHTWFISNEVWDYTSFDVQYPVPDGC